MEIYFQEFSNNLLLILLLNLKKRLQKTRKSDTPTPTRLCPSIPMLSPHLRHVSLFPDSSVRLAASARRRGPHQSPLRSL